MPKDNDEIVALIGQIQKNVQDIAAKGKESDKSALDIKTEITNLAKIVDDLKKSNRELKEAGFRSTTATADEDNSISKFLMEDGKLQLTSKIVGYSNEFGSGQEWQKGLLDSYSKEGTWEAEAQKQFRRVRLLKMLCRDNSINKSLGLMKHITSKAPAQYKDQIEKTMYDGTNVGGAFINPDFWIFRYIVRVTNPGKLRYYSLSGLCV